MRLPAALMLLLAVATAATVLPLGTAAQRGTIRFVVWGQPFEDRLFADRYARAFERDHPGITVDYQRHADPMLKYNAWHARGTGAEVMRLRVTDYHQMVARGMLLPLDDFIADADAGLTPAEMAAFPAQLLEDLRVDGRLFALPEDTAQFGLFYNRTIFDQWNREHPDEPLAYPSAEWTWADLRKAARTLTRRGADGEPAIAGFDMAVWEWPFMHFFLQAGGRFWNRDGSCAIGEGNAAVAALLFLGELVADGSWSPSFGRPGTLGPDARFAAGQTAMLMDGSWTVPSLEIRAPELDFAVAPPPRGATNRSIAGSVLWGISASAPNPRAGWSMLRWLVQEDQAAAYWDVLRVAPPAHLGVVASRRFRSTSGVPAPGRSGAWLVPPMPPERFEARAAWILHQMEPGPDGSPAPAFIPVAPREAELELVLRGLLLEWLSQPKALDAARARSLVDRAAAAMNDPGRAARAPFSGPDE